MRIFKFGGASVRNAAAIRNLQHILAQYPSEQLFVIVSALGKTTNALERIAASGFNEEDYLKDYQELVDQHTAISNELLGEVPAALTHWFRQLQKVLDRGADSWELYYDQVVCHGELMSTTLIHAFLKKEMRVQWLDARSLISTDADHTQAKVDWDQTRANIKAVNKDRLNITQGFIGRSPYGDSTTLGREGSDYSAAIFAHVLEADDLVVWKDVPGIMTTDPKWMPKAQQYRNLSYRRAVELTYYGAKVIHPKTMAPLAKSNIPMQVRSFLDLQQEGTLIAKEGPAQEVWPTIVIRQHQVLVSVRFPGDKPIDQMGIAEVFRVVEHLGIQINLMQNSALSFSFVFDYHQAQLDRLRESFQSQYAMYENKGLHLVTLMNYTPELEQNLPAMQEVLIEQRTRHHYRVLYLPV